MVEYIDVLNENGVKTGNIMTRKEIHKKGLWHRAIVVAIVNEENEILLQQRSPNKDTNANLWDISVSGHVSAGQDSILAAIREINEELMINVESNVSISDFRYIFSYRVIKKFAEDHIDKHFYDFFVFHKKDIIEKDIKLQEDEVQAAKFVSLKMLEKMLQYNEIVKREPVYEALFDYLHRY